VDTVKSLGQVGGVSGTRGGDTVGLCGGGIFVPGPGDKSESPKLMSFLSAIKIYLKKKI
jgi:hypothetical protein